MKENIYTHTNRVALYRALIEKVGTYNINDWHFPDGKHLQQPATPCGFNTKQETKLYQEVYNKIVPKHFGNKPPKSARALMLQVKFCLTTQPIVDNGQRRLQTRNRLAAYEAGFMKMTDIMKLETLAGGDDAMLF